MTNWNADTCISRLLDENSFVEIGQCITARQTTFTLDEKTEASDGVVTGYGLVDGNLVFVYAQNQDVMNGTIGEMHARKITGLYDMALKAGAPVIGLLDCGGFRLQESTDALMAFGSILQKQTECSGKILQICGVTGTCAGGLNLLTGLSDFTFLHKQSNMFVNAPHTLEDPVLARTMDSAAFQSAQAGNAQLADSMEDMLAKIRQLVTMLVNQEYGSCEEAELNRMLSAGQTQAKDVRVLLEGCADYGIFFETGAQYHPEMVTGFFQLNGVTVGAVATSEAKLDEEGNVAETYATALQAGGCEKAADFVAFCADHGYPVVSFLHADGFAATKENEVQLPGALAKLVTAFSKATVTKISVITGDTYGTPFVALNSKAIGADLCFAWPEVHIGMMEAEKAATILFSTKEEQAQRKAALAYDASHNSVEAAAARGVVDGILEPAQTRKQLVMALTILLKKEGNQIR